MKFSQVIEYNRRNIDFQKSCKKRGRESSFRPLFYIKKEVLFELKASGLHLSFNIFR